MYVCARARSKPYTPVGLRTRLGFSAIARLPFKRRAVAIVLYCIYNKIRSVGAPHILPSHQTGGDSNSRQFDLHASACFPVAPKFYFLNDETPSCTAWRFVALYNEK